ncbi:TetR/AcrR family transcriptional regulator [Denitrobaculum tricleocarpae]|uniref:TetR family transcriptional regulator n=1 Tax=Denitrobaculum tricleocarpae TaxID=2591009 RepID=A0A545TPM9_9PROT|nr:TetR family transcriptional regulator [Denitrobaculum tricleocarpae]TQV79175.1 TetR family transcriptional regulator [Denitrobaculum tricleocarpae]
MKSKSARSPKGEARRDAIEVEGRRMLLEEGYARVSLRAIAMRLGISVGNLQYYFPTKDDLVEAVIAAEIEASLSILDGITWDPGRPGECIHGAARALLHHHAGDSGRFYAIAEFLALNDPRYARLKARGYAHVFGYVEGLVHLMASHLEADLRARLAHILVALIDGASLQVQFAQAQLPEEHIDALAYDVAEAIQHLLKNWK